MALVGLLGKTMILKGLSPERAALYLGCSGRQIRRWIEGKTKPTPIYLRAIEAGIQKINREVPDDIKDINNKTCPRCGQPVKREV